jgi:hypothetical protein
MHQLLMMKTRQSPFLAGCAPLQNFERSKSPIAAALEQRYKQP